MDDYFHVSAKIDIQGEISPIDFYFSVSGMLKLYDKEPNKAKFTGHEKKLLESLEKVLFMNGEVVDSTCNYDDLSVLSKVFLQKLYLRNDTIPQKISRSEGYEDYSIIYH